MNQKIIVGIEDIDELLELSNNKTIKEIIEPMKKGLMFLEENVSSLAFMPDVARITTSVDSFKIILDSFAKNFDEKKYKEILRNAGKSAGDRYSENLIKFLVKQNRIPKNEKVLMQLAMEFDSLAGFGEFNANYKQNKIIIEIKNNFLSRIPKQGDRDTVFFEGYIWAILWTAVKETYRLFRKHISEFSFQAKTVLPASRELNNNILVLEYELVDETLNDAYDNLFNAKSAFREGNLKEVNYFLRNSIESAFREKTGMDKKARILIPKILKSMKEKNIKLEYSKIENIYGSTSSVIHGAKEPEEYKTHNNIYRWLNILREFETFEISQKI